MFNVEMIMIDELRRCRRHQWPIFKGLFQDLQGGERKTMEHVRQDCCFLF